MIYVHRAQINARAAARANRGYAPSDINKSVKPRYQLPHCVVSFQLDLKPVIVCMLHVTCRF